MVNMPIDVLSIQSQTCYSQVGNTMVAPILQSQGLMVAQVPTVILSNTPQYATCHGQALPPPWFEGLLQGIVDRGVTASLRAVLVGYLGKAVTGESLAAWLRDNAELSQIELLFIDPVLGDVECGFYVEPALADVYRQQLLPLATICAPNVFELEQLSGTTNLDSYAAIEQAARSLLVGRLKTVLVTSITLDVTHNNTLAIMLIQRDAKAILIKNEFIPNCASKGTGDMFAAGVLAQLLKGIPLATAVETATKMLVTTIKHNVEKHYQEFDSAYVLAQARRYLAGGGTES